MYMQKPLRYQCMPDRNVWTHYWLWQARPVLGAGSNTARNTDNTAAILKVPAPDEQMHACWVLIPVR